MKVLRFLEDRTKFIRRHYDASTVPFLEIIKKIEEGKTHMNRLTARTVNRHF